MISYRLRTSKLTACSKDNCPELSIPKTPPGFDEAVMLQPIELPSSSVAMRGEPSLLPTSVVSGNAMKAGAVICGGSFLQCKDASNSVIAAGCQSRQ